MGSSERINVYIQGDEYTIKADVDSNTARQVAEYVNSKINEIQESTAARDRIKVSVLAAMNIAGELFEIKQRMNILQMHVDELEAKTGNLNHKIDQYLR